MYLQLIDYAVIIIYLLAVISLGFILRKQTRHTSKQYLLADQKLSWWMLGVSNASGMFDISGTLWMVALLFVYGLKSIWIPWLWPVFNQVFLFAYLSSWIRKSNVTTGAEWMLFRFGKSQGSDLAHKSIILFALLTSLSFLAYGFIGLGKFVELFIPYSLIDNYFPFTIPIQYIPHFYGLVFTIIAVFYSVIGGMTSIVWADILQYCFMTIGAILIASIAVSQLIDTTLTVPLDWNSPFFNWDLPLIWESKFESVNQKIINDGYNPFGLFFILMTSKGILASLAGPVPNYDMQRILATKSPKEAALMSMSVNVILLPVRYLVIGGFTILGLLHFDSLHLQTPTGIDFEKILPAVLKSVVPAGLIGFFLVELMAAFMGTFAGTLNTAQAYLINDIYLKTRQTDTSEKEIQRVSLVSGILIASISASMGLFLTDVNSILQWIVGALYSGFIVSNVLKWYWWRFNATGFFASLLVGILGALVCPFVFKGTTPIFYYPLILSFSLIAAIIATYLTPPTPIDTLSHFYKTVNPWGYWKPIQKIVLKHDPNFKPNTDFKKDMLNVFIGVIAQTCLTALPIFALLLLPVASFITFLLLISCCVILWFTWYKKLI